MDRADATGLGIAFAGHAALFSVLALGFAATKLPPPKSDPIVVEMITEDLALVSTAPTPSAEVPAPMLAPEEGPPEPAPAPSMPEPAPVARVEPAPAPQVTPTPAPPRPAPAPTPKAVQRPQPPRPAPKAVQRPQPQRPAPAQPKAAPARPAPAAKAAPKAAPKAAAPQGQSKGTAARPTGRLNGLLAGLGARETPSKATAPPAQKAGPAVTASLGAEVRRQLKPHWKSPTGADAELLRTTVRVSLSRNGGIADIGDVTTSGQTASNRSQVKLHQEQAIRAVRLAAPFRLPVEYYDAWKEIAPVFDRRLSQ